VAEPAEPASTLRVSSHLADELLNAYNAHDVERIGSLLSETFLAVTPDGPIGPYGWKKLTIEHFKAFHDAKWTKVRLSDGADKFVLDVLFTGTNTASRVQTTARYPIRLAGLVLRGKIETLRIEYDRAAVTGS
jgi:hypothetical protein